MHAFMRLLKCCALAFLAWAVAPALAVSEVTGTTPGGAAYRIAVPDGWQPGGSLVLVQHPYLQARVADPVLGALRDLQLAQGFAVAASGYRQGGWALFSALDDNAELIDEFTRRFGAPGALHATGQGMGALAALKIAEDPRFRDRTRGVLAMCPIFTGVEFWESIQDLRVVYDALCVGISGGELPRGDEPFPWATNRADIPAGLPPFEPAHANALLGFMPQVTQCTGLGIPAASRTSAQNTRLADLKQTSSTNGEDFLVARLAYAAFGLGELLRGPHPFGMRNALFNEVDATGGVRQISYRGPIFDSRVRRIRRSDPFAYFDFERMNRADGSAGARLVVASGRDDQLAVIGHQEHLQTLYRADARRLYTMIVDSAPGHCAFSPAEVRGAWNTSIATHFDANTPQVLCITETIFGLQGPCRFAVPPRPSGVAAFRARSFINPPRTAEGWRTTSSGVWFDPARDGEGIVVEELGTALGHTTYAGPDQRSVLVSWYTYAPPGDPDPGPRWLIGLGVATGEGVYVPALTMTRGARFGGAFRPGDVQRTDWGSVTLVPDAKQRLHVRYNGPPGWEGSARMLQPLARVELPVNTLCCVGIPPAPPRPTPASASGTYFHPSRDGEGIQLQILEAQAGVGRRATLVFYTYDSAGRQLWLTGVASGIPETGGVVSFEMTRSSGGVFGDTFNSAAIGRSPWGTVAVTLFREPPTSEFDYTPWRATELRWNSVQPGFESGGYPLVRLTQVRVGFYE